MTKTRDEVVEMMMTAHWDNNGRGGDLGDMQAVYDALIAAGVIPLPDAPTVMEG